MIVKNIPNNFKSETEKSHSVDLDLLLPVQMTPLPHTLALYSHIVGKRAGSG